MLSAGPKSILGYVDQDPTMMGLDAAEPKGILGLAGGSSRSSFHQDPMALGPVGPIRVGSCAQQDPSKLLQWMSGGRKGKGEVARRAVITQNISLVSNPKLIKLKCV
jgi:hypothetical protein